uniref:Uncharacterized protein n=1 Tax=Sarcophilus harrisii TaxID=9305 RepID=G3VNI9_SARHA
MAEPERPTMSLPGGPAGGEGANELVPDTEPAPSAAVSPGTEEPTGDAKKKIYICESVFCSFTRSRSWNTL